MRIQEPPTDELLNELLESTDASSYLASRSNDINMRLSECLGELLTQKGLKVADVIGHTSLSTSYAYEIFNGTKSNIGRDRLLQLAFAMGLNAQETQRLLKRALLSELYVKNERDAVIIYCLARRKTLEQTNQELFSLGYLTLCQET